MLSFPISPVTGGERQKALSPRGRLRQGECGGHQATRCGTRSYWDKDQLSAAAPPGVVLRVALGIVRIVAGINFAEVRLSGGIDRLIGVNHMP